MKTLVEKIKESKSGTIKVEPSGDAVDLPKITKITAEVKKPESKEAEKADDAKKEKETEGEPEAEEKKRPRRKGALDLDLFMKVKEMLLCTDETTLNENAKHSVNMLMVEREGSLLEAGKGGSFQKGGYQNQRGRGRGGQGRGGSYGQGGLQRQKITKEVQEMMDKAEAYKKRILTDKDQQKIERKIKLILNQISPDNFQKKIGELREIMFPEMKTKNECFEEGVEYDDFKLSDETLNEETL